MIEGQGKSDTSTQANSATVLFTWAPWFDIISHSLTPHQQVFPCMWNPELNTAV